jgi:hypothetical protein
MLFGFQPSIPANATTKALVRENLPATPKKKTPRMFGRFWPKNGMIVYGIFPMSNQTTPRKQFIPANFPLNLSNDVS